MTGPVVNGPCARWEPSKSAPAAHIEQQEEHLLEEFAHLMGTEVSAVRLFDRAAGPAPGETRQASPRRVEQITKQGSDAGAASTVFSPKGRDESPVISSGSHRAETHSNVPSLKGLAPEQDALVAPRKSGRATLLLATALAIGGVGVIGAWAAVEIAPDWRTAPLIGMAADASPNGAQPLRDTTPSPDRAASILPAGEAGEPNPLDPASSAEHATELQQPDKSPPAAPLAAASSGDPAATSSASVTRSVAPTELRPVAATTADQTVAPTGASGFVPDDPKQAKADLAGQGGSVAANDASAADAKRSSKVAEAAVLPPQPARPPVPLARPSFNSSSHGAPQPLAHKTAARRKSSSRPINHAPNPKAGAAFGPSPPPLDVATAPGAATVPVVTKTSSQTPSSTDSLLQFVPNLFEKGASAVRGFIGDASRGG